jgi:23S rRNA (uracil1939-C5)-methyltransferase
MVEIESLDLEGRGVGHREGKVVFVEGGLPGERVLVTPVRIKPSYETGRVAEVLSDSAMRVTPSCPHFGIGPGFCGGCAMQHLEPRAQVAIKQRVLEDALWHIGRVRAQTMMRPIHGPTWGYRYRARLTVRHVAKKGGVLIGFHERGSSFVADMRECKVLPPHVSALLLPLRDLIGALSIYNRLPQIELAIAEHDNVQQTALVFRNLAEPTAADRELLACFGKDHGVVPWLQPAGPETAAPLDPVAADRLLLGLPEFGVSVPFMPTDFTQVNHRINEVLVRRAVRLLAPGVDESVADFFCGLGNFTLPLATCARRVVGLEGSAGLMAIERTLSIIKPDAVAKNVIGKIYQRFEEAGLKIIAARMAHLSRPGSRAVLRVHKERPFFKDLVSFMTSGPVMIQVLEGEGAIAKNRELMGATDPKKADAGTIRADFADSIDANAVHGSDAERPRGRDRVLLPGR